MRKGPQTTSADLQAESLTVAAAYEKTGSRPEGLTDAEAAMRRFALRRTNAKSKTPVWLDFLAQFRSPILVLLVFAAVVSGVMGETSDAAIIIGIILLSSVLSFYQEHHATSAVEKLRVMTVLNFIGVILKG